MVAEDPAEDGNKKSKKRKKKKKQTQQILQEDTDMELKLLHLQVMTKRYLKLLFTFLVVP